MKPSLPHDSKFSSSSVLEPFKAKPTWGELRARLEVLAKKKRSVKRKPQASPEGCPPARGKILKAGASSSPSSAIGAGGPSGGPSSTIGAGGPSGRGGRSSYFGLESHVIGRCTPSCNAERGEEGSLWFSRG